MVYSEEATGKYISRAFAEFFRRGIKRTCQYEFVDEGIESLEGSFWFTTFQSYRETSF